MTASMHHKVSKATSYQNNLRLLRSLVDANHHGVVTLERLECQLLLGLDAHLSQLSDFLCEDGLGGSGRIDTVGLDGDDDSATNLEEETGWKMISRIHDIQR